MKEQKQYIVISDSDIDLFQEKVTKMMKDGFKVEGSMCLYNGTFYQSMYIDMIWMS